VNLAWAGMDIVLGEKVMQIVQHHQQNRGFYQLQIRFKEWCA